MPCTTTQVDAAQAARRRSSADVRAHRGAEHTPRLAAGLLTTRLSISASPALFCALTSLVVLVARIPLMRGAAD
ncbi:hypothetical protein AA983_02865 [Dermacoccus sp. PE3]|nr:hypothetical protein AA983_02865 [Dermacoccus sp. PE3]